jgi:hypothetical protein
MDIIKQAAVKGMIVVHPSSSTYFLIEELTGHKPESNYWVCGLIAPRGTCFEMGVLMGDYLPHDASPNPQEFRTWYVISKGRLVIEEKVSEILAKVKQTDVFVKGVNALDTQGNVGILIGDPIGGGPLGPIFSAWRRISFHLVFPAGLEKLILTSIDKASKEAKQTKYNYAMGLTAGLLPCPKGERATVITEVDAINMLTGAVAVPVAAGGLGGAEGAITMVIKGDEPQVKMAIDFVEQCKGAQLPQVRLCNCSDCPSAHCSFPVTGKSWI